LGGDANADCECVVEKDVEETEPEVTVECERLFKPSNNEI
jgi:hypothetical protein